MKFGVVGVLNTLINLAVFNALLVSIADVGRLKANFVATAVATVFAYLMSRYWTFKDRQSEHSTSREFLLFVFLNLIGLHRVGPHRRRGLPAGRQVDRRGQHRQDRRPGARHDLPVLGVPHVRLQAGTRRGRR